MLGENELKNLADRALALSQADQTEVGIFAPHSALTRFANSYIHQNVEQQDVDLRVRAVVGKKIGVASSNDLSDEGLRSVVERAVTLADYVPEDQQEKLEVLADLSLFFQAPPTFPEPAEPPIL